MLYIIRRVKKVANLLLEYAVILTMGILVLDVLWGVASRYLMQTPSRWTEEVATFLLIWIALLGAAIAYERREHLGVDYFVSLLHAEAQLFLAAVVQIVVLFFVAVAMVFGGTVLVWETLAAGQATPALGIKMGYVYLAVPVSGAFIVLSCLERLLERCKQLEESSETVQEQNLGR